MKQFFKTLLASVLGLFLGSFLIIILFIIIIVSFSGGGEESFNTKENSVLYMTLNQKVVDNASNGILDHIEIPGMNDQKKLGLNDLTSSLKRAKTDDNIKGIYLDLSSNPGGLGTIEEIRNAIIDFKESGKWVIAYSEYYSHFNYYIATAADEIYLYPEGEVDFRGFRTELMFFKGALEKLDIVPQIIRGSNNKFKSAMEPFMYDQMSDANREQTMKYLTSMWGHLLNGVSVAREVSIDELNMMADSVLIQSAADAVKYKLVDKAMYKDEVLSLLREKLEIEENDDIETACFMDYIKYEDPEAKLKKELGDDEDKIAVVYATGSIESGNGDDETIGSERISKAIRKARLDSTVKAVVLRVNSPGGSALASDVMWREMVLCKAEKPVIVSMGDVAASGGYYIACPADRIFANPTTITGSIGVFGMLPYTGDFFKNKLGITTDRAMTNAHSDMGSSFRMLDDFEFNTIQKGVDKIYMQFTTKVAEGRGMTQPAVDEIGQGRVWTGIDALENGLVDELGGLTAAINYAATAAELEDYDVTAFPKEKDPFEQIILEIKGESKTYFAKQALGNNYKIYEQLDNISTMEGYQMRLPYLIDIR